MQVPCRCSGSSIGNGPTFKNNVSGLVKHGWIFFDGSNDSLNINSNSLPTYIRAPNSMVNAIRNEEPIKLLELKGIKVLIWELFNKLTRARYIKPILSSYDGLPGNGRVCEYHYK